MSTVFKHWNSFGDTSQTKDIVFTCWTFCNDFFTFLLTQLLDWPTLDKSIHIIKLHKHKLGTLRHFTFKKATDIICFIIVLSLCLFISDKISFSYIIRCDLWHHMVTKESPRKHKIFYFMEIAQSNFVNFWYDERGKSQTCPSFITLGLMWNMTQNVNFPIMTSAISCLPD